MNYAQQGGSIWSVGGTLQILSGGLIDMSGGGQFVFSATTAITAHAGGGQASAVALTSIVNTISTVATSGDSVKLPQGAGQVVVVANQGANSTNVFPFSGDSINALSANAAYALAAGHTAVFWSAGAGKPWYTISGT